MTSPSGGTLVGDDTPQAKPFDINTLLPSDVNTIHQKDDADRDDLAHHHTLGPAPSQAAPGNHPGHMLGSKPTITGSRGGNAALTSLLTALASRGIITDGTTA